jgi:hypothetical protein
LLPIAASNCFKSQPSFDQFPSVPVASWRDLGALLALDAFGRNGNGSLFNESTAVRKFCGIA